MNINLLVHLLIWSYVAPVIYLILVSLRFNHFRSKFFKNSLRLAWQWFTVIYRGVSHKQQYNQTFLCNKSHSAGD